MKNKQSEFTLELVLKRLTAAEIQLRNAKQEIELKNQTIVKMQTKLGKIEESISENDFSIDEYLKMKEKIEMVENLLGKYGLTLENEISKDVKNENSELKKIFSTFHEKNENEKFSRPINKIKEGISFGLIVSKISDLNESLEKELKGRKSERKKGSNIHKLV